MGGKQLGIKHKVNWWIDNVHSDDLGLVLPPKMAPIQVVITTITQKENEKEIMDKADEISKELQNSGARVKIDNDDLTPGEKFFKWEKKGVPIRIEIGEKELKNKEVVCVTRYDGDKINIQFNEISKIIINMLDQIQKDIYERALKKQNESIKNAQDWDDLVEKVSKGNFVLAFFCCECHRNSVVLIKGFVFSSHRTTFAHWFINIGKSL